MWTPEPNPLWLLKPAKYNELYFIYLWQLSRIRSPEERRAGAETNGSPPAKDMLGNRPVKRQNWQLITYFHWIVRAGSGSKIYKIKKIKYTMQNKCNAKIDDWWLKKSPKKRKNLSILWKRSAIELQSISVHYERLKTCPDRLHWCCVLSTSTVLPPLVSFCTGKLCCCCICSFPSHFAQIRAQGRRDLLAIFWVFMKTLPHFQSRKNVHSFAFRCVHWSAYHISRNENKRHDHFQKMSSTYHIVCNTGGWGEAAPGCETLSAVTGGFSLIQTYTGGET